MSKNKTKTRLFSEFSTVSRNARIALRAKRLITDDDIPVGWVKLSAAMVRGSVLPIDAKRLIVLEVQRGKDDARRDLIHRLVTYVTKDVRHSVEEKIEKLLK